MVFLKWGKRFKHGRGGVKANKTKALDCFLKGAARGSTLAMVDAGLIYWEMGKKEEGIVWYRKAAELGDPAGQCNLAISYLQANPPNTNEGIKWLYLASYAGHVRAQYQLALCLHQGRGVGQSLHEAAERQVEDLLGMLVLPPSHTSNHPASPTTPAATPQLRLIPHLPAAPIYSPILKGWSLIGQSVEEILKRYSRLRLTHGRKVLEVRPVFNWQKGKAVEFLLESLGSSSSFIESFKNAKMDMASKQIIAIRIEVDNLAKQVASIELEINRGKKVVDKVLLHMIKLLMTQLIKLDGIAADGDVKLQRRMQVKRVQKYIETLDMLKIKNSGVGNVQLHQQDRIFTPKSFENQQEQRKRGKFGGASGIGLETTRVLALRNAHVFIAARNMKAANEAKQLILKDHKNARVDVLKLDMASVKSIKAFADNFIALNLPLNILMSLLPNQSST
ncbi:hypothetical protein CASFOL_023899 [Castilleja foliolosa]|uniref:BAG domain-containing protein n=1 Tax=Castilleja foliolosa TaxID=1961234 RepID=A0ABD3CLT1_9LAMI